MPSGFEGLENAAKILAKLKAEREQREQEDRWLKGDIKFEEIEEVYQEYRGKFSEAYFSGSALYAGTSFKDSYMNGTNMRNGAYNALVGGLFLDKVISEKVTGNGKKS